MTFPRWLHQWNEISHGGLVLPQPVSSFESLSCTCFSLFNLLTRLSNVMDLPQELIDEIINILPDTKIHLRNCSLVAKSWIYPSRRRLFETVDVVEAMHLKLWLDAISPTNVEVLQHVRSLTYQIAEPLDSAHEPVDPLRDYYPSFRQLESLGLYSGRLPSLTQIGTSPAFQHTVLHLSLQGCSVTARGLVTLVNYLHNLAHLELIGLCHRVDGQPAPPFSRPLQKLSVTEFYTNDSLDLIDQLVGLHPRCDEVTTDMFQWSSYPSLAQRVIGSVGASVKRLNLDSGVSNVPKY